MNKATCLFALTLWTCGIASPSPAEAHPKVARQLKSSIGQSFRSIDDAIAKMDFGYKTLLAQNDRRAIFMNSYVNVLMQIRRRLAANEFIKQNWSQTLMLNYANLYRIAVWADLSGRTDEVPKSWQLAFSKTNDESVSAPVLLMLSINAHISRDLPVALHQTGVDFGDESSRKDFFSVDKSFESATAQTWPIMEHFGYAPPSVDKALSFPVISHWIARKRLAAWNAGNSIAGIPKASRAQAFAQLDERTTRKGRQILTLKGILR